MARGVFGQLIYVNWEYNIVAVKLSSWPDFLNDRQLTTSSTPSGALSHRVLRGHLT